METTIIYNVLHTIIRIGIKPKLILRFLKRRFCRDAITRCSLKQMKNISNQLSVHLWRYNK